MVTVTVVRIVPPSIIGVTGVVPDHAFAAFEESLDWLEAMGTVAERIDPHKGAGGAAPARGGASTPG